MHFSDYAIVALIVKVLKWTGKLIVKVLKWTGKLAEISVICILS